MAPSYVIAAAATTMAVAVGTLSAWQRLLRHAGAARGPWRRVRIALPPRYQEEAGDAHANPPPDNHHQHGPPEAAQPPTAVPGPGGIDVYVLPDEDGACARALAVLLPRLGLADVVAAPASAAAPAAEEPPALVASARPAGGAVTHVLGLDAEWAPEPPLPPLPTPAGAAAQGPQCHPAARRRG